MTLLIAAISLGFFGSFHCIGMCGPIALALPIKNLKGINRILSILIYNVGRAFTYTVFGVLAGLLGMGLAMGGMQQAVSITLGVLLLLSVFVPKTLGSTFKISSPILIIFTKIKSSLQVLFHSRGPSSLFTIGLLNGVLPCGLVYVALAAALSTANVFESSVFMFVFGMGTFPLMTLLPYVANNLSSKIRGSIRKTVPVVVALMALALILRGLNLGIPFLSPQISSSITASETCHDNPSNTKTTETKFCPLPQKISHPSQP